MGNDAKLARLRDRPYRVRDFFPGARVGDWFVEAVWMKPAEGKQGRAGEARRTARLRCAVCGHVQEARVDNVRMMRLDCAGPSWGHKGRPA